MDYQTVFAQWSAACRDIVATQFGYAMDAWKNAETKMQAKPDWMSFWKK
jgi:hypothetical protein